MAAATAGPLEKGCDRSRDAVYGRVRTWQTMITGRWLFRKSSLRAARPSACGPAHLSYGMASIVEDRLPPGCQGAESDVDVRALSVFMEAFEHAQALDRHSVRERAAEEFDSDRIVGSLLDSLNFVSRGVLHATRK